MSRFRKLSHTIWHCQYHILWTPKYRLRILTGQVAEEVTRCIRAFSEQKGCKVIELNVQIDHVHLIAMVVPKISISEFVGIVKGRTAIRIFNKYRHLKQKPYWGESLLVKGVLCRYRGIRCRKGAQIREVSRAERTSRRTKEL